MHACVQIKVFTKSILLHIISTFNLHENLQCCHLHEHLLFMCTVSLEWSCKDMVMRFHCSSGEIIECQYYSHSNSPLALADSMEAERCTFFWTSSARVHSDSRRSSPTVADSRRLSPIRDRNIRATKKKVANALWPRCAKHACEKPTFEL